MKKQKGISLIGVVIALAVIIVAGFLGWKIYNNFVGNPGTGNSSSNDKVANGLVSYKNDKYGIKFNYPKEWGKAQISDYPQTGKHFEISFTPNSKLYSITAAIDSSKEPKAFTSTDISKALSGDKSTFLKYDSSSYSTLSSERNAGIDKNINLYELNIYQIVNLPKINANAVMIAFSMTSKNSCPGPALSNTASDCVSQTVYDFVNKFAKSIQAN